MKEALSSYFDHFFIFSKSLGFRAANKNIMSVIFQVLKNLSKLIYYFQKIFNCAFMELGDLCPCNPSIYSLFGQKHLRTLIFLRHMLAAISCSLMIFLWWFFPFLPYLLADLDALLVFFAGKWAKGSCPLTRFMLQIKDLPWRIS